MRTGCFFVFGNARFERIHDFASGCTYRESALAGEYEGLLALLSSRLAASNRYLRFQATRSLQAKAGSGGIYLPS